MAQQKQRKRKRKKQDKEDWLELCDYISLKIMGYDRNIVLPIEFEKDLEKMSEKCDTFELNEDEKDRSIRNYYYNVVLNTYRFCSEDIKWALKNKEFKNDLNKFRYIYKIVEKNLQTVYVRMKNAEVSKETKPTIDMSVHKYKGAEYKSEKKRVVSSRLRNLWNEVL